MFAAVLLYLDNNAAKWNTNSVVSAGVLDFRTAKNNLDTKAQVQEDNEKKGYTDKKNADFESMLIQAYTIALRTHNYAVSVSNLVMAQATLFSKSSLAVGSEQEITKRCTAIASTATAALATIPAPNVDYKITTAGINNLQNTITLIMPDTAQRDVIGGAHTDSTATLVSITSDAQTKLKSLDRLIEGMVDEDDEEEFISGYEVIRKTKAVRTTSDAAKTKAEVTK